MLGKNFTLKEFIHSDTALACGISNYPTKDEIDNIEQLVVNCLQPIRDYYKKPLIITSGFRCKKLNEKIRGAANSQHTKGQAADFIIKGIPLKEIINWVRKNIKFDQLILEKNQWIHISYNKDKNRNQVLYYNGISYSNM